MNRVQLPGDRDDLYVRLPGRRRLSHDLCLIDADVSSGTDARYRRDDRQAFSISAKVPVGLRRYHIGNSGAGNNADQRPCRLAVSGDDEVILKVECVLGLVLFAFGRDRQAIDLARSLCRCLFAEPHQERRHDHQANGRCNERL